MASGRFIPPSERPCRLLVGLAFVVVTLLASPAHPEPRAAYGPTEHDFGLVQRGEKVAWTFRLHNGGDTPLEIRGVRLSMPGMRARFPETIEPARDATISVEWTTDRVQGRVRGVAVVDTNDARQPPGELVLSGTVQAPLDIDPMAAVFISAFQGEDVRRELTVRSNRSEPVSMHLGAHSGTRYVATLDAVEPGRAWRLTVKVAPDTPPGRYAERLELETNDAAIGTVRLPVSIFVKADVYANPHEIDFGTISLDRIRRQPAVVQFLEQVVLVKKREGTFRVRSLRSDVAVLVLRATPPAEAVGTVRIDAGLRPAALQPGSLEGTIWIETDDPQFPSLTVRVHGRVVDQ